MNYPQTNEDWAALTWLLNEGWEGKIALTMFDLVDAVKMESLDEGLRAPDEFYGGHWYTILNKEEFL